MLLSWWWVVEKTYLVWTPTEHISTNTRASRQSWMNNSLDQIDTPYVNRICLTRLSHSINGWGTRRCFVSMIAFGKPICTLTGWLARSPLRSFASLFGQTNSHTTIQQCTFQANAHFLHRLFSRWQEVAGSGIQIPTSHQKTPMVFEVTIRISATRHGLTGTCTSTG